MQKPDMDSNHDFQFLHQTVDPDTNRPDFIGKSGKVKTTSFRLDDPTYHPGRDTHDCHTHMINPPYPRRALWFHRDSNPDPMIKSHLV